MAISCIITRYSCFSFARFAFLTVFLPARFAISNEQLEISNEQKSVADGCTLPDGNAIFLYTTVMLTVKDT